MRVVVLGAAAGGGFPQWNANNAACRRARAGDPAARVRTQCSIAVSGNDTDWIVVNASPDLRQQIEARDVLHPRAGLRHSPIAAVVLTGGEVDAVAGLRHSPIAAVVLTGGEVDAVAGLLHLRERQHFALFATASVQAVLRANPIFDALAPDCVERHAAALDTPFALPGGLTATLFAVPGKLPLYLERDEADLAGTEEDTAGLRLTDAAGGRLYFIPGCARFTPELADRLRGAPLVFFDSTLWTDDEMIREGSGQKTGQRMGHISLSGPGGTIAAFRDLNVRRKIMLHINNSNPVLLDDTPEHAAALRAGWEIAHDGMEIT